MTDVSKTASLAAKIAASRAKRIESAPVSTRRQLERVYGENASPRQCIKMFCLECIGFDRRAVAECASYACPLFNIRPFQMRSKGAISKV